MSRTQQIPLCDDVQDCRGQAHCGLPVAIDFETCERAAAAFRALGDPQRLQILVLLETAERRVS